jgi:ADP-ribose pyrophosphatase
MTKSFTLEGQETKFDGFYQLDVLTLRSTGVEGSYTREVFMRGRSVCVLVFDPALDKVLLVEELRAGNIAAGMAPEDCYALSPIAGMVDEGERPFDAMIREGMEEAGIDLSGHVFFGPRRTLPSPGGSSEIIHHYLALADLSQINDGDTFGEAGEHEFTTVRIMDRQKADDKVIGGIANGLTATCLMWLENMILTGRIQLEKAAA